MATPADQRLLELLAKWLTSLELHSKYCSLDDASYAKIQPWPEHQRPSRWIIDLARQKALALQAQIQDRIKMGDAKFSDSLELMTFLANLVGSQHIERFIPLAEPAKEHVPVLEPPDGLSAAVPADAATATREMPRFIGSKPYEPAPVGTATVARTERKADKSTSTTAAGANKQADAVGSPPGAQPGPVQSRASPSEQAREQVIADATRLVQWGRKWYELAELIASMANRPHLTDVRRILKDNKAVIDERAGRTESR